MKRAVLILALLPVAATGCFGPFNAGGTTHGPTANDAAGSPVVAVHAERVNDGNAHAMALSLKAEMDADATAATAKSSH